jgi:hypothetical protein
MNTEHEILNVGWLLKKSIYYTSDQKNFWIDKEDGFFVVVDKSYILDSSKDKYILVQFKDIINCAQIPHRAFMGSISMNSDYCYINGSDEICEVKKHLNDLNFKEVQRLSYTKGVIVKSIKILEL